MASVRFYWRQPWQLLMCLLGIALGVAAVAAMNLAIDSSKRGFQISNDAVFGAATHSLDAGQAGIDEQFYLRLRTQLRVIPSAPVVAGEVFHPQAQGQGMTLSLLGIDPLAESGFRNYLTRKSSRAYAADAWMGLMTEPGSILASAQTLTRLGVSVGQRFTVQVAGRTHRLQVIGVLVPENNLQRLGLENVLVTDIASAQELLDLSGQLTRVDLILSPSGVGTSDLSQLQELLPQGVRLRSRETREQAQTQLTQSFFLNLRMLSLLALVVGLFIVYNALTFSVVRRREWIGVLRAVGVSARGIVLLVLAEAFVLGVFGTLLGIPIGLGLAQVLLQLITRSLEDLYFAQHVSHLEFSSHHLPAIFIVGIAGSLLAALAPALEAIRITPRAAMLRSELEQRMSRLGIWLGWIGLLLLALIPFVLWWSARSVSAGYCALFLAVLGFSCLTPVAIKMFSYGLQSVLRRQRAHLLRIALGGIHQGLSRNATAVTALMIALAASVGVGVMVDSFRHTLNSWLSTTLQADIYIAVDSKRHTDRIDPALVHAISRLPGIASARTSRDIDVITERGEVWLKALDANVEQPFRGLTFIQAKAPQAWQALTKPMSVVISESFAWRHQLKRDHYLTINSPVGERRFKIVGVFRDYGSQRGMVIMDFKNFVNFWKSEDITDIGLYLADQQELKSVLDNVQRLAENHQALRVFTNREIREKSMEIFDQTFAVTQVLKWLAIIVAVVGILSALTALQLEQRRLVAVLRAQGLTRGELFSIQEIQTGCLGLLAGLLALPLGLVLSALLVEVINKRAFGWSLEFHLAPDLLLQAMLIAVGTALIAGLYPAWTLSQMAPAQAMRGL